VTWEITHQTGKKNHSSKTGEEGLAPEETTDGTDVDTRSEGPRRNWLSVPAIKERNWGKTPRLKGQNPPYRLKKKMRRSAMIPGTTGKSVQKGKKLKNK